MKVEITGEFADPTKLQQALFQLAIMIGKCVRAGQSLPDKAITQGQNVAVLEAKFID